MLYKYLRSLVEDMPRPGHNFTAKQSRMLKAIKAVCGILSGIANTNKQRFASRLRKFERQKSHQHYKASSSYVAHAHEGVAETFSTENEVYEATIEPIAIADQDEQELTYTDKELDQNLAQQSLDESSGSLVNESSSAQDIANTNKQRFASRLRKFERQKSHQHYKASSSYVAHAHEGVAETFSTENEVYEATIEPIAIADQDEQELTYTDKELDQNLAQQSLDESSGSLVNESSSAQDSLSSTANTDSADISELLSASYAHDNKEALLKIKAMADEVMMNELDHN